MSPCHGEDRRFDSDRGRQIKKGRQNWRLFFILLILISELNMRNVVKPVRAAKRV